MDLEKSVSFSEDVSYSEDVTIKGIEEKGSDYYFSFYSSLLNQSNMIRDVMRTGTYRKAILGNGTVAFKDKVVLDVGAGSGILSFLAAQAGAKHVIALEASNIAEKISIIVNSANHGTSNPHLKDRIRVVRGMVENELVQKIVLRTGRVDTIISEPIGVMLVHERMVESFILARDLFLKPGGQMFPSAGHIFFCPFTDPGLYDETNEKAQFYNQTLFGTDFRELYTAAQREIFSQPIIGMFPPTSLLAPPCPPKSFDFYTCKMEDLYDFFVPIDLVVTRTALIHGLASWFDLDFFPNPSSIPPGTNEFRPSWDYWNNPIHVPWRADENALNPFPPPSPPTEGLEVKLTTGPYAIRTHWQQTRLLLPDPLAANMGERIIGSLRFQVNDARSYDLTLDLCIDRPGPGVEPNPLRRRATYNLAQQCFNYSYNPEVSMPGFT
ncbi:MAG: hypothetical protein TREMPRED_002570 [Tremellales sp. Tagirdzhanova-0007]|nr:MAG: hypothetical protein TREMPRED_002570 [Tremellales sp. Tagirdzhanova-0007]